MPHGLLLARRVERAEPAAARHLEDDPGAAGDLVERELLALRLVVPVGRVAVEHLDAGAAFSAPAWKPAMKRSTGGSLKPPTEPITSGPSRRFSSSPAG